MYPKDINIEYDAINSLWNQLTDEKSFVKNVKDMNNLNNNESYYSKKKNININNTNYEDETTSENNSPKIADYSQINKY